MSLEQLKSTGNPDIDGTHKKIVKKLQSVVENIDNKRYTTISTDLQEILQIVSLHFKEEEALMMDINYPFAASHIAAHNDIVVKILYLMEAYTLEYEKIAWLTSTLLSLVEKHVEYYDVVLFKYNTRLV